MAAGIVVQERGVARLPDARSTSAALGALNYGHSAAAQKTMVAADRRNDEVAINRKGVSAKLRYAAVAPSVSTEQPSAQR